MFIRDVRRSGCWFPESCCILEHQTFSFGKDGRWFCVTGAALRMTWLHFFEAGAILFGQITKRIGTAVTSALNFPFLKEVSQNCFVFDVVNFEKWGSLAELFCFWRCQVQKLRKSRKTAAFLMLSSSKIEEVSQNSFVFKFTDRQIDR